MRKMILLVFVLFLTSCISEEASIREEIEKANYCESDIDCVSAGSKCPFGCWNFVNAAEVERISALFADFETQCVYGCVMCEPACEEGKCVEVCQ